MRSLVVKQIEKYLKRYISIIKLFAGSPRGLRRQILQGGMASLIVKTLSMIFLFSISIVLARMLGPDNYGLYSSIMAVVLLLVVVAQFGMPLLLVREIAIYREKGMWSEINGILRFATILGLSISVGLIILVLFAYQWIDSELNSELLYALILIPILVLSGLYGAAIRGCKKIFFAQLPELVLRPMIFLVILVSYFTVSNLDITVRTTILFYVASSFMVFVFYKIIIKLIVFKDGAGYFQRYDRHRWLNSSLVLFVISFAGVVNSQIDVLILGFFKSQEDVGIYRVSYQSSLLVVFALQTINIVTAPYFASMYKKEENILLQKLVTISARIITLFAFFVFLFFYLFGKEFIGLTYGDAYLGSYDVLVILSFGQLISAAVGPVGYLLSMSGYEGYIAKSLILSSILNLILNIILIPVYGATGAAVSMVASLMCSNLYLYIIVKEKMGVESSFVGAR